MQIHAAARPANIDLGLQTFTFHYEWRFPDGAVARQSMDIQAYGYDAAEILFAYRVTPPHGAEQVMLQPARAA